MKNKLFLYSLTSLAVTASSLAYAESHGQDVMVPVLEGGLTASVGTFYVTPTSDFQNYYFSETFGESTTFNIADVNPGYQFGIDASLGYIFEETANSIELFFRNVSTSDTGSIHQFPEDPVSFNGDLGYELNSFDLMLNQFVNLGDVMQVRLSGGLAYVELERNENVTSSVDDETFDFSQSSSEFKGLGPRVSIDTRYGFSDDIEGLGIVGGGSMAYFLGDLDSQLIDFRGAAVNNDPGNHAVMNFRANLGLDYVYFFDNDEGSTLGLELGYLIDYYDDAAETLNIVATQSTPGIGAPNQTSSVSFAGPYVNLKGVF